MSVPYLPRPVMMARYHAEAGRVVLPDVRCDIVCAAERLTFIGPMTTARRSSISGRDVILLSFDPIAARAFIGTPLIDLVDRVEALDTLAPRAAISILEWLFTGTPAAPVEARGCPVEEPNPRLSHAARRLALGGTVGETAEAIGLGERQFERVFERELGLTPKVYGRILRLRRAIELIQRGETLAGAAAFAGYFDQSHFNRDVRALTGSPPTALLRNVGNVQDLVFGGLVSARHDESWSVDRSRRE